MILDGFMRILRLRRDGAHTARPAGQSVACA
jgi:hypothetical protein